MAIRSPLRLLATVVLLLSRPAAAETHTLDLFPQPQTDLRVDLVDTPPQSQPYVLHPDVPLRVTVELETLPGQGLVVTSVRFDDLGFTLSDGWSFTYFGAYGLEFFELAVDWEGVFAPLEVPLPAVPTGPNESRLDLSPLRFEIRDGYTQGDLVSGGAGQVLEHDVDPVHFPLSGIAVLRVLPQPGLGTSTIRLRVPIDSAQVDGWVPEKRLVGEFVLAGQVSEAGEPLPVAPGTGPVVLALLLASGRRLARRREPEPAR